MIHMESIDRLRRSICGKWWDGEVVNSLLGKIDEVEAEIEERCISRAAVDDRFMPLQLDANGVPIRVGDTVSWLPDDMMKVIKYAPICRTSDGKDVWHDSDDLTHVKPDPIKELLEEFGENVARQGNNAGFVLDDMAKHYAAKLPEAVGGDACGYENYEFERMASQCKHVRPRTVEDVLEELLDEYVEFDGNDKEFESHVAKYAAELKEMMSNDNA